VPRTDLPAAERPKTIDTLYQSGLAPWPKSESKESGSSRARSGIIVAAGAALILLVWKCASRNARRTGAKEAAGPASL